ncbi:Shikimate dehydrogenase (NADP(+)) [Baekduia alba]|uniref:shikimate dehydrogenase n=1 Tax=Baekduia alba TaxID=2997333 RepID=UPI0023412EF8|nr:shikimate dehydrogenase [Baekduia alba]WCB94555.1 Shikimate dehydrogenase (NADP(+)) [Baekduia alba]
MKRLGVLGWPVGHSRSPAMHNAALRELGLGDWHYQRLPVPPEVLAETVAGLPAAGFVGANVTIPHKEAALALADDATEAARAIGAANTLTFDGERVHAANTDAPGFLAALRGAGAPDPAGSTALVLGAGGSARAVAYALREAGAARVAVWNRSGDRARTLAADLGVDAADRPMAADLLVNCTSVGLSDGEFKELPVDADALGTYATVADLVYRAGGTGLVAEAQRRGCTVVDGLEVLVRQGALSFQAWTGLEAPIDVMRAAAARGAIPEPHDPGTSDSSDRRAADPRRTDR